MGEKIIISLKLRWWNWKNCTKRKLRRCLCKLGLHKWTTYHNIGSDGRPREAVVYTGCIRCGMKVEGLHETIPRDRLL